MPGHPNFQPFVTNVEFKKQEEPEVTDWKLPIYLKSLGNLMGGPDRNNGHFLPL